MATSEKQTSKYEGTGGEQYSEDGRDPSPIHTCEFGAAVAVTLGGDDLRRLGINPDRVEAVTYRILNGAVLIEPISK